MVVEAAAGVGETVFRSGPPRYARCVIEPTDNADESTLESPANMNPATLEYASPNDARYRAGFLGTLLVAVVLGAMMLGLLAYAMFSRRQSTAVASVQAVAVTPAPQNRLSAAGSSQRSKPSIEAVLAEALPPGGAVYEEDAIAAAAMLDRDPQFDPLPWVDGSTYVAGTYPFHPPVVYNAHSIDQLLSPSHDSDAVLFFGKLKAGEGASSPERIVVVWLSAKVTPDYDDKLPSGSIRLYDVKEKQSPMSLVRELHFGIFDLPAGNRSPSLRRSGRSVRIDQPHEARQYTMAWTGGTLRGERDVSGALRLMFGSIDPDDPAAATVRYELGQARSPWHQGELRIRLLPGDQLEILPTTGKVDGGVWMLPGSAE